MAKRSPRWGVHFRVKPGLFWEGLYKVRSSYVVRGRNETEAMANAGNRARREDGPFIVRRLT